jgi:hypothetical protein
MSNRCLVSTIALALLGQSACGLQEYDHRPASATVVPYDAGRTGPDASKTVGNPGGGAGGQAGSAADARTNPDPAPGDPGVTIDGTFVPRARAVVFLHIGHSNMAGRASTPADLRPFFYDPDPHLWTYAKGGAFSAAREPTAPDNEAGQAAGPGMALLRSAQAMAPADAFMISIGHGHSGSFGGNCAAFRRGGLLYDLVMDPARELKGRVTFAGIFTMFGQSEHNVPAAQQKLFAACLQAVAEEMRADLGEPALPYIVGGYEMGISRADIAPDSAFARPIIAQMLTVPSRVPRSALIPTDGFPMQDDHHFNLAGHKLWAAAGIALLIENRWAPWAR